MAKARPIKESPPEKSPPPAVDPVAVGEKVVFYLRWCKRCGICSAFCPKGAVAEGEDGYPYLAYPERCNSCGLCEVLCPDFAISVPQSLIRKAKPATPKG